MSLSVKFEFAYFVIRYSLLLIYENKFLLLKLDAKLTFFEGATKLS